MLIESHFDQSKLSINSITDILIESCRYGVEHGSLTAKKCRPSAVDCNPTTCYPQEISRLLAKKLRHLIRAINCRAVLWL
jgi:hypothetical protein